MIAPMLIVVDDPEMRALLHTYTTRAGHRGVEATCPAEALELLARDRSIALVLSEMRLPAPSDGVTFIRTVQRRWPEVPLAAITASPDDLAALHGRPECPVLILSRPVWEHQVRDVFCWVLESRPQPPAPAGTKP